MTTPPAEPTPVEPFDATVAGVQALLPHATLYDALPTGRRGVTTANVTAWLTELSNRVDLRLSGWRRLRATATAEEEAAGHPAPLARLTAYARDLVHNGAASYAEAARFPERADTTDTAYAGVLWARFTSGLDELTAWLKDELTVEGELEPGPDAGIGGDVAYSFPDPFPWSSVRF